MNVTTAHELAASRLFLQREDVSLIHELVDWLPKRQVWVADLGAGAGTTALAVFERRLKNLKVITVDIDGQNLAWSREIVSHIDRLDDWLAAEMDAAQYMRETAVWFDLVLLDTSHEYQETVDELREIRKRLRPGGYLWCHDYVGYEGVTRAVDEAVQRGDFKKIVVQGLGWAGKIDGWLD